MLLWREKRGRPVDCVSEQYWGNRWGAYKCNPQMNTLVMEKPMRERTLGTHHVRVFLRRHPLLVFFRHGRAIDLVLEIAVWFAGRVRGRAVFVGLRYYGSGFGSLRGFLLLRGAAA
jgi:hypothetical protein